MRLATIFWATAWLVLLGGCIYAARIANTAPSPDANLPSYLQMGKFQAHDMAIDQAWMVGLGSALLALCLGGFGSILRYLDRIANAVAPRAIREESGAK